MLMGPAVGGGLMMLLGPAGGLLANVLIYVPLVWWLARVPYGSTAHRKARLAEPPRTAWAHMLHALKIASGNRTVMSMVVLAGVSSFLVGNAFQAQMPEYAHDLGTDHADLSYSVLFAANAAGALAGGIVLESRGLLEARARTAIVFALWWSLAIGGFALAGSYLLAVALMFAAGFLNLAYSAMAQTLVQLHAPGELRGRLVGLFNMSNNGLRAFSGVTVGFLGSAIGIHASLALSAAALLAITVALLAFAVRGRAAG
jgi:MFS family permease